MNLREAKIILPRDADKRAHEYIRKSLGQRFGGYTAVDGHGYWEGLAEDVTIYYVAVPPDSTASLRHIAAMARDYGRQNCVYLCDASGNVELV